MISVVIHPDFQVEKEYAIAVLLSEILGVPYCIETDVAARGYLFRLPNGHSVHIQDGFWIDKTFDTIYTPGSVPADVQNWINPFDGTPMAVLFGNIDFQQDREHILLGGDLIAAAFFMLTRWEEYALREEGTLDEYGRFPGAAALASRFGFLDRPVVNEWAIFLFQCFVQLGWPERDRKKHHFQTILSCDVDHPRLWWSPQEVIRTIGGALFRGKPVQEIRYWWKNGLRATKDPFDTFDELMAWGEQHGTPVQFNFLSERPRHFDAWYDLKHPVITQLMQKIAKKRHIIGFHPSREAVNDPIRFGAELTALRQAAPLPVVSGRHHYLCFHAPFTWKMWEDHQLEADSTLGYSDLPGFRCGICMEFQVFDFLQRRTLLLREQPLIAMEVTFARYLDLDPEKMLGQLRALKDQVQRFDGQFTLLWHNSSFNTFFWVPFRTVFEQILA
jgi:hypothetical protein